MIPRTGRKAAIRKRLDELLQMASQGPITCIAPKALDKFKTQILEMPIGPVRCPVDELVSVRR